MSQPELELDSLNSQNLKVMQAYADCAAAAKASSEDYDGWLQRIDRIPEFNSEELTRIHGQLIAMGFLKFEITGRSVGLRYQISTRGKNALERAVAAAERERLQHVPESDSETDSGLAEAA